MKFENTEVFGFKAALRGMRNPKESWDRSDSWIVNGRFVIGENDMKLAKSLISAGSEHRKFLRYIHVQVDMTAPLFFFKEYDTYKLGTTSNSTSTMHKISSRPIRLECFEIDDMDEREKFCLNRTANDCEAYRQLYLDTKDKKYWKALIRLLPESWLQTRTIDLNYETLRNIYHQRVNHKLTEWHTFCKWVETLPYSKEFIID